MIDLKVARDCCQECLFAYDAMVGVAQANDNQTLILRPQQKPTSAVLVLEYSERRMIVFPGTTSEFTPHVKQWPLFSRTLKDWLANFKAALVENPRGVGKIHAGFLAQYLLLEDALIETLQRRNEMHGRKPLIITGHSQGAAIAQICSALLPFMMQGFDVAETHAFAPPRPGDEDFAKSVNTPSHRYEYGGDIVPHVPLTIDVGLPFGHFPYHPMGSLSYGRPNLLATFAMEETAERLLIDHRRHRLFADQPNWIHHHHLPNYLSMIEEAL